MKIEMLHIYGFGKFQDQKILVHPYFYVLQGENEAGKSTLRAFIQVILFGFPTKKDAALRYEPKQGSRHGGTLTVQLENGTRATIERIAGKKSAGEVTIFTEDGHRHGEDWLLSVLGNMDRAMFKGIFCFGLEGLSEIQHLKGEDLNKYIYEAGMTGTKHIAQMEKKLNIDIDALFKPKGRNPSINTRVKQLHDKQLELKEWEAQFDKYDRLIQEMEEITAELDEIKRKKSNLELEKEHWRRKQTILSFYHEKNNIERHLTALAPYKTIQLEWEEQWNNERKKQKDAKNQEEEHRLAAKQIEKKMQGACNTWFLLYAKDRFDALRETLSLFSKYKQERESLAQQVEHKQSSLQEKQERLGKNEDELSAGVSTLYAEEELNQLVQNGKGLKERYRLLQEQYQQQMDQLSHLQHDLNTLKENKQAEQKQQKETTQNQKSERFFQHRAVFSRQTAAILFSVLGVWAVASGSWLIGTVLLGAAVSVGVLWFLQYRQDNVKTSAAPDLDQRLNASIRDKEWELERETNRSQSLAEKVKEAKNQWEQLQASLEKWAAAYQFPVPPSLLSAEAFFSSVREWKEEKKALEQLQKEREAVADRMKEIEDETTFLQKKIGIPVEASETAIHTLVNMAERAEEQNRVWNQAKENWMDARSRTAYFQNLKQQADEAVNGLYEATETTAPESFEQTLARKKEHREWEQKQEWLLAQFESHLYSGETINGWMEEISKDVTEPEEEIQNKEKKQNELQRRVEEQQQKLAELRQERLQIEESGTYDQMLQDFEEKKQELQNDAQQWMVLKTAAAVLNKAKVVYEKERQPEVIQTASSYFSYLTRNHYSRLFAPFGEETFIVEDNLGFRFSPEELSRGTAEQLYLSVRLALAENYKHSEPLPFIMDDPFVNFDRERRERAFSLLKQTGSDRQILYFTCEDLPPDLEAGSMLHHLGAEK